MENSQILAEAVLTRSPAEVAALYKKLGNVVNSCRALGLACRYRGLETVKVLVENGATFRYVRHEGQGFYSIYYWLSPLEMTEALREVYFINSDPCFSNSVSIRNAGRASLQTLNVLPIKDRAEVVRYLYQNRERIELDAGKLLFYSIISNSKEITSVLKELGAKFSEKQIIGLTEDGRSYEWLEFCPMMGSIGDDEFLEIMQNLAAEIGGKKFHYTDSIYWANCNPYRKQFRLFRPDIFKLIIEIFDQKKMNKTQLMKGAIEQNNPKCLEMCAELGWLKMPRKRDEMIQYATEKGMTECTAFLLEFKNRTADLVKERANAEKKMLRELNADPNSVTELKKIWSYEKREDGTLRITSYKGKRGEIEVPREIGKSAVTEIGAYAFSAGASRLRTEQCDFRRKEIKKIVLPETVTVIGEGAFASCGELEQVNIPDGVTEIGAYAFGGCPKLKAVDIPKSVKAIGKNAFTICQSITEIAIPEGVSEIGDYTFSGCSALKSVKLPNTIEKIGIWAFNGCTSLEEIIIPDSVTEIGRQAFINCKALKTAVLPASVKKIKNYKYRDNAPEHIFMHSNGVTVIVEPKSCAEKYCKRYDIKYRYREEA